MMPLISNFLFNGALPTVKFRVVTKYTHKTTSNHLLLRYSHPPVRPLVETRLHEAL